MPHPESEALYCCPVHSQPGPCPGGAAALVPFVTEVQAEGCWRTDAWREVVSWGLGDRMGCWHSVLYCWGGCW